MPGATKLETVTVKVAAPAPVMALVLKFAFAPGGSPLTLSATMLLISVGSPTFTAKAVFVSATTVCNAGYLAFDAVASCGLENDASSSLGFTVTLSMRIFSGGTGVSRNPVAVLLTGRTFVSRTKGICRPFTGR